MNDPTPPSAAEKVKKSVTFGQCLTGAAISSSLAIALYFLTTSIAQTFAQKPLPTGSAIAQNLSVAVRTLVVGAATLATGLFAVATVGLIALGIQTLWQQRKQTTP
ncbi:DUF3082 domain-containing protein [Lusitaniella coriacea LEGE 07157]|uniref:DUF3082 domain-containing protein n=1 Tax=Lusitaniella coriacea LEGE 07157 TaxID=945747 RepID=A0A8J7AMX6_9CYAN|nr:DUF3082 domain-containing protein [Lusitaniella coriacea]MBE9114798.1 DUF3082 domain-containing protein [Lusitaniella coriacea LEGE 07157]